MNFFMFTVFLSFLKKIESFFHLYSIYHQPIIHNYYAGWSVKMDVKRIGTVAVWNCATSRCRRNIDSINRNGARGGRGDLKPQIPVMYVLGRSKTSTFLFFQVKAHERAERVSERLVVNIRRLYLPTVDSYGGGCLIRDPFIGFRY